MKRIAVFFLTFTVVMSILTGCTNPEPEYHNINENVSITDAKISKMDSETGRFPWYKIWIDKDGKATEFKVDSNLFYDIEKILNTAKMVGKEKETKFDVVTDGKDIISVTLVSNRK